MYVKRLKDDEILQIMRVISDPDCEIVSIFRKVTDPEVIICPMIPRGCTVRKC